MSACIFNLCVYLLFRGGEKVVWVPAEEYKEPVDEKRKRKKKTSLWVHTCLCSVYQCSKAPFKRILETFLSLHSADLCSPCYWHQWRLPRLLIRSLSNPPSLCSSLLLDIQNSRVNGMTLQPKNRPSRSSRKESSPKTSTRKPYLQKAHPMEIK